MVNPKILWLIFLTLLSLANGIYLALKIIAAKKSNPGYGERIATLEKGQEDIEKRLDRIEGILNRKK
jgi:hypothetical protein